MESEGQKQLISFYWSWKQTPTVSSPNESERPPQAFNARLTWTSQRLLSAGQRGGLGGGGVAAAAGLLIAGYKDHFMTISPLRGKCWRYSRSDTSAAEASLWLLVLFTHFRIISGISGILFDRDARLSSQVTPRQLRRKYTFSVCPWFKGPRQISWPEIKYSALLRIVCLHL